MYSLIILLPFLSIYGGFTLYNGLVHVYPIFIISILTFIVGVFVSKNIKNFSIKVIFSVLIISSVVVVGYYGMPNWLAYAFNRENNKSRVESLNEVYFLTENKDTLSKPAF